MSTVAKQPAPHTGADLLVKSLEAQGVEYIFGIPGAKIDKVFDTLLDSKIKTVACRHEQNAAFIAGGIGRMTGKAGVALVTSGPGCSNLVTGLGSTPSRPTNSLTRLMWFLPLDTTQSSTNQAFGTPTKV
jgi:acetolactate synthase-1/2/3 large subunit